MENLNSMFVSYICTNFISKFEEAKSKDEIYFLTLATMSSLMFLKQNKDINDETILNLIDKLETVYYKNCERLNNSR